MHLLYNESTEINIFIFTATNSPCVFVFHAESIEISRPYLETAFDFSYKYLLFVGPPMVCFSQKFGQHMFFLGSLCKPPCFSVAWWIYMLRFGKLRRSVYEFEFDFFNEILFADHKCSFRLIRNVHLLLTKLFYFSNTSSILYLIRKKQNFSVKPLQFQFQ